MCALVRGDIFRDPQWMPEPTCSTEPRKFFLYLPTFSLTEVLYGFSEVVELPARSQAWGHHSGQGG